LDASQVAWRRELGFEFSWPLTKCLDADLYEKMGLVYPEGIPFSGFVGQYKGVHPTQLCYHDETEIWAGQSIDVPEGRRMMPIESIYELIDGYVAKGNRPEAKRICELGLELHEEDHLLRRMHESLHQQP
jgi:hypothetical protein